MTIFSQLDEDILFPDSDGKPMADNTEQYRWIVIIKENLEILLAAFDDVFIAGDLFWYPVRSQLVTPTAPDVMVVFGRPKAKRRSYRPDGQRFLNSIEQEQQKQQEYQRAEQEYQRAEQAELLLQQERQRAEQMAAYLRSAWC
jgi:Uma2 family endonuclease